jgi:ParB family transcriptional regulator, chromosome partitioning protein
MKGRDALRELLGAGKPESAPSPPPVHRSTGSVKAMNLGLQRLSEEAAAAKSLRATLANSAQVVELDAAQVDHSFIVDRLSPESDAGFAGLKAAIATHGQQVPILVRPHPDDPARYQAAYGHRRLRAARELGRSIKAIIKPLTDVELVVAQGQENSERADLSFIERALFASRLAQRGFDRDTMTAALSVDKPELSRLLSVSNGIDGELIRAIGPAPKIGRPRWLALVERMNEPSFRRSAQLVVLTDTFSKADSNARFNLVFAALSQAQSRDKKALETPRGKPVAWVERTSKGIRLGSEDKAFVAFLDQRLPELLREFECTE